MGARTGEIGFSKAPLALRGTARVLRLGITHVDVTQSGLGAIAVVVRARDLRPRGVDVGCESLAERAPALNLLIRRTALGGHRLIVLLGVYRLRD